MKKLVAICLVLMFCSVAFASTLRPKQNTGTDLDNILFVISNDEGLLDNTTLEARETARKCAHEMNTLILKYFKTRRSLEDGIISVEDLFNWNYDFRTRRFAGEYRTDAPRFRIARWTQLHGDDENGVETGYHCVQNNGSAWNLYDENAINTVFDGIYHMGFVIVDVDNVPVKKFDPNIELYFRNEDGDRNAKLSDVADWLNMLMLEDLASGFELH